MNNRTTTLVGMGLLTAIVVVLQVLSLNIRFGMFSITLTLVPIIVGAALFGPLAGAWLGLVFSVVVIATGDAMAFMAINIPGTFITVLAKGTLAGFLAGLVYDLLSKKSKNQLLAVVVSGIVAPVVNTGLFVTGCLIFFYPTLAQWGEAAGFTNGFVYIMVGLVGLNFVVELLVNMVLSSVVVQLVSLGKKQVVATA